MPNTALNRTVQLLLTNKSGGNVAQGDVVVIDTSTASAFTTTTTSAYVAEAIGVVLEPNGIANNASGMVAISGYVPVINLSSSASLGDFVKTHTVAKQGVRHATPSVAGDFAQVLATGASPAAFLFGFTNQGGGGGTPGGSDKNVQYDNAGAFGGIANNATATDKFLRQVSAGTPSFEQVTDADLSTSNITTNDVSITKHGFAPVAPNDATKFLNGTGAYSTPSGGAITQAYVGYNTIGGSVESPASNSKVYAKKITLANDCLLTSIGAYVDATDIAYGPSVAVLTDSSGPAKVIAYSGAPQFIRPAGGGAPRWVDVPIGVWLVAGDYWIAVRTTDTGGAAVCKIYYDGSGSDNTGVVNAQYWVDWSYATSPTVTSNKYSIRGNTIR